MTASIVSLDPAASGLVRHRFVRALGASTWVSLILLTVAAIVSVVAGLESFVQVNVTGDLSTQISSLAFLIPLFMVEAAAIGAAIDLLHRRLVALVFGVAIAMLFVLFAPMPFQAMRILLGSDCLRLESGACTYLPIPTPDKAALLLMWSSAAMLICYECLRQAWWQLTVGKRSFLAARGWRPVPWRLFTTIRRHLGMPNFLANIGRGQMSLSLIYFGVAVLNIGVVLLLAIPMLLDNAKLPAKQGWAVSIGLLLLLNLFGAGHALALLAGKSATKIYQDIREWDARAPILFLRAFSQDDTRLKSRLRDPFAKWPGAVGRRRTLDEILLEHASPYGPVIAIGDPRDTIPPLGAARVFVAGGDDDWQGVVRDLTAASGAVVICPNDSEGVTWELELIAQFGTLVRAIYLANPELSREANLMLFRRILPDNATAVVPARQTLIAAYQDAQQGWHLLTAKSACMESYTAGLNMALQTVLGQRGTPFKVSKHKEIGPARRV